MEQRFYTDKINKGLKGEKMSEDLVLPENKVIKIPLMCMGRDKEGKGVLKDPHEVIVCIFKSSDFCIQTYVECNLRSCNYCGASNPNDHCIYNWPECPLQPTIPFVSDKLFEQIRKQEEEKEKFSEDCDKFFASL